MRTRPLLSRDVLPVLVFPAALLLLVIGVVMADTQAPKHVPIAIEPDAERTGGAAVATFALG